MYHVAGRPRVTGYLIGRMEPSSFEQGRHITRDGQLRHRTPYNLRYIAAYSLRTAVITVSCTLGSTIQVSQLIVLSLLTRILTAYAALPYDPRTNTSFPT